MSWPLAGGIMVGGMVVIGIGHLIWTEVNAEVAEPDSGTITEMEYDFEDITWCIWFENESGAEGDDCIGKDEYEELEVGDWYEK